VVLQRPIVGGRGRRQLPGQFDRPLLILDVGVIPPAIRVLGLGERPVRHRRPALAVVADPRTLRRERLRGDELARLLEPGREVVHEADVVGDLLGRPTVHGHVVHRSRSTPVVLEQQALGHHTASLWRAATRAALTLGRTDPAFSTPRRASCRDARTGHRASSDGVATRTPPPRA
jgi:hypothetical protein